MYHEEAVINDVLCWRGNPNGEWTPYTPEQLTSMILTLQSELEYCDGEDL